VERTEEERGINLIRILFVCHGNICRSPMAEFVMKDLVKKGGLEDQFEIASAATSTEELGNPVYSPARRKLAEHGIRCDGKTARQIRKTDYAAYDFLVGMDHANLRNMERICGGDPEGKISLLLDWADREHPALEADGQKSRGRKWNITNRNEVADPWYTGDFEATWQDVCDGCRGLLVHCEAMLDQK